MNRADILFEEVPPPAPRKTLRAFAERVLDALNAGNRRITIVFCNDTFIRLLNKQYRQKDEPTDVLSFGTGVAMGEAATGETMAGETATGETVMKETVTKETAAKETRRGAFYAGDIVISVETLEQNSREFSVDKEEELRRLIIHGILHLSGMDHATNDYEGETMLVLQEKLIKEIAWT